MSSKKMLRCPKEIRASYLIPKVRRGNPGKRKAKPHPELRPTPPPHPTHTQDLTSVPGGCPWWPTQLTQRLLACHSLVALVLHTASLLFQRWTQSTPVPWLLQDLPLADTVGDLTGLDTATPATPLGHNAGDRWKRKQRLQKRPWRLLCGGLKPVTQHSEPREATRVNCF